MSNKDAARTEDGGVSMMLVPKMAGTLISVVLGIWLTKRIVLGFNNNSIKRKESEEPVPAFLTVPGQVSLQLIELLQQLAGSITDEALIKLIRQMDFWVRERLPPDTLMDVAHRLAREATTRQPQQPQQQQQQDTTTTTYFQCPTVRFGRTELLMPIVTTGCMRFPFTIAPDHMKWLHSNRRTVLSSTNHDNVRTMIQIALRHGMNHFETARFYGSSEYQLKDVLLSMIQTGQIKRQDFILQTKIPVKATKLDLFDQHLNLSLETFSELEYIDLLTFHCVGSPAQIAAVLDDAPTGIMAKVLEWKQRGRIKHIGFSTHSIARGVYELVNSNKFDFVNLHYHLLGSYHGSGTSDTRGGQGNLAALQRALELDMGVFIISPADKAGKLFAPSSTLARLVGSKLNPMQLELMHVWKTAGAHTASCGFARPVDFDDAIAAAQLYAASKTNPSIMRYVHDAEDRLRDHAIHVLGQDWVAHGLHNIPDPYEPCTRLMGVGHMLWLHNLVKAYGMYSYAEDRYYSMQQVKYDTKKSFEENAKKMPSGNIGRCFDPTVDLMPIVSNHTQPHLVQAKLQQVHEWLRTGVSYSEADLYYRGWDTAYDLTTWIEYPNFEYAIRNMFHLCLHSITNGWYSIGGGPNAQVTLFAQRLREAIQNGKAAA